MSLLEDAIDAITNAKAIFHRLEMYVRSTLLNRFCKHDIEHADHGRIGTFSPKDLSVFLFQLCSGRDCLAASWRCIRKPHFPFDGNRARSPLQGPPWGRSLRNLAAGQAAHLFEQFPDRRDGSWLRIRALPFLPIGRRRRVFAKE